MRRRRRRSPSRGAAPPSRPRRSPSRAGTATDAAGRVDAAADRRQLRPARPLVATTCGRRRSTSARHARDGRAARARQPGRSRSSRRPALDALRERWSCSGRPRRRGTRLLGLARRRRLPGRARSRAGRWPWRSSGRAWSRPADHGPPGPGAVADGLLAAVVASVIIVGDPGRHRPGRRSSAVLEVPGRCRREHRRRRRRCRGRAVGAPFAYVLAGIVLGDVPVRGDPPLVPGLPRAEAGRGVVALFETVAAAPRPVRPRRRARHRPARRSTRSGSAPDSGPAGLILVDDRDRRRRLRARDADLHGDRDLASRRRS